MESVPKFIVSTAVETISAAAAASHVFVPLAASAASVAAVAAAAVGVVCITRPRPDANTAHHFPENISKFPARYTVNGKVDGGIQHYHRVCYGRESGQTWKGGGAGEREVVVIITTTCGKKIVLNFKKSVPQKKKKTLSKEMK
ncbi:hypothetical protein ElyMa_001547900 [Elysia marginata]|uniref:Uncharacterized protein n=1 Tax=Elysia marginata TaxID=1093978 RepID=A0AAV4JDT9_9GAST|nr:hypothetical protein ElyMa_001547900 [Elysia marginata]